MDGIIKNSIKNFKFVFSAQSIVLLLGLLRAILIPIILSIQGFGYWQIYLLYSSYVGMFALGFNDGIYLRYGSFQYEDLPHKKLRTAIRLHVVILLIFSAAVLLYSGFIDDSQKQFAIYIVSANILILGINGVFIYILQITNQIKRYSFFSILPQIILTIGVIVLALVKVNRFEYLVIIDLFAKSIAVIGMICCCKELWIGRSGEIKEGIKEYQLDVSVGIQLMLAQLMGMFVTGIGRFIVEWFGEIEDYSYYSLGITITSLVLVLITSVSMLAYPTLKRLNEEHYPRYYEKINSVLQKFNFIVPLFYFLAAIFIILLIPKYEPVLKYLNLLFGVIMLQAKMQLLNNTFYKALRKETAMMKANINSVVFFTIISLIIFPITKNVWSIALCTFLVMVYRCYWTEIYLRRILKINDLKGIILELFYITLYVTITSVLTLEISFIIYGLFLFGMVYRYRIALITFIRNVKLKDL